VASEKGENGDILRLKFVITRELKLKQQHFVVVGGMTLEDSRMLLVGNSKVEGENPNENRQLAAQLIFNTHQLEVDEPQQATVKHLFKECLP
jgi:hypothetical protein